MLEQRVRRLAEREDIFSHEVFAQIISRLCDEMSRSDVDHIDLRVGVVTSRWPWIRDLADAIEIFRDELANYDALTVSFLGAVNLSKPSHELDRIFTKVLEDGRTASLLKGLDINLLPGDLDNLNRYLNSLLYLQQGGLRINFHLGELFDHGFSRHILSKIIPDRVGHGVLLLDNEDIVQLIKAHDICLDMCPVSNTLLGVCDWKQSSPAVKAMRLGIPVTINTDDPVLFGAGLSENIALAGLPPDQLNAVRLASKRYGYSR